MWGVLAGQLLLSKRLPYDKIKILAGASLLLIIIGYALDPVTPIIKRICTSSFVIVSGGWCLFSLGLSYWVIDVLKINKWSKFFAIVGMNPLFIYLFAETGGTEWIQKIVRPFTMGFFNWLGYLNAQILTSLVVWGILWYICYWLYKKKIFIRI
jgi:predicted acyltransferase